MQRGLRQLFLDREAELGVSVIDAAKLAGMDVRQYQKYRNDGVIPQGPQRKRLSEGLGLPAQELNAAIEREELADEVVASEEQYVKWLEAPASREDVRKLEAKIFDIESQLRELRGLLEEEPEVLRELRDLLERPVMRHEEPEVLSASHEGLKRANEMRKERSKRARK